MCFLSFKKIKGSGEEHKGWTVKELKHEHNLELEAAYISNLPRLQIFDRPVQATMSICDFKSNQDIFLILKHFTIQGE